MKVLITGSAGFIGAAISQYLLKENQQLIGLDNLNDYYQNQFPFDVDDQFFKEWLTQALSATDNGIYDVDASVLVILEPVKVNGDSQIFTMDHDKFFQEFPGNFTGAFVINDAGVALAIGTSSTSAAKNGF